MNTTVQVLDVLLKHPAAHGVDSLARAAGVEPPVVLRALNDLRAVGCSFDEQPGGAISLRETGLGCWSDYVEAIHAWGLGQKLHVYRDTASTQATARSLASAPGYTGRGDVVVADHQTAGRGRLERRWFAPPGSSILMTAIVRSRQMSVDRLMLAGALAVAHTVESFIDGQAQVRWPNDVLIEGRKVAGLLIETMGASNTGEACETALIGIGLNVRVEDHDLPPSDAGKPLAATSLHLHVAGTGSDRPPDRLLVLHRLLEELEGFLFHADPAELRTGWRRRSSMVGERVTVQSGGHAVTGRVLDVDVDHGLILADDAGAIHTLHAATATLL